jgi:hypothetical protein
MDKLMWRVDRATVGEDEGWELVAACAEPEDAAALLAAMGGGRVRVGRVVVFEDFQGQFRSCDDAANKMLAGYAIARKDGRVK